MVSILPLGGPVVACQTSKRQHHLVERRSLAAFDCRAVTNRSKWPRDAKFSGKILKVMADVKEMGAGEKAAANKANAEAARKLEEAK